VVKFYLILIVLHERQPQIEIIHTFQHLPTTSEDLSQSVAVSTLLFNKKHP